MVLVVDSGGGDDGGGVGSAVVPTAGRKINLATLRSQAEYTLTLRAR